MKREYVIGLLRIVLGFLFFWAFLDKIFGLGFSTASDKSWLSGVSPTLGFLGKASYGPFSGVYHAIAGNSIIDFLFMFGLFAIGISLVLGIAVRFSSYCGALLVFLMWTARLPPKTNPIIDEHIIYLFVFLLLRKLDAGSYIGFGKWWSNTAFVKKLRFLA